jgi:hypothetical protein
MKIEITKNQLNSLINYSTNGKFIIDNIGEYDRFGCMPNLIDKISIFSDVEWKNISRINITGKQARLKLKTYVDKNFPANECYCLGYRFQLEMILAVNFYKNKSGCIPFFDNFLDPDEPVSEQDVYWLLVHKKDYLKGVYSDDK